ncbi:MAG: hypothetical protein HOV97_05415 [Nonomuraea sp.]|nr:hypothetical protein [Nonomuraea sp.]
MNREALIQTAVSKIEAAMIERYSVVIPELDPEWAAELVIDAMLDSLSQEWGVRFPSGSVQACDDEDEARRYSLTYNNLRPDLPTLVVRKVATDWEVPA